MTRLGQNDLHVWTVALDGQPHVGAIFSAVELARAARFVRVQDRDAFLHARGALRVLLGRYLGVAPGAIEIVSGAWGKPELAGTLARTDIAFNVAHTGAVALIAIARDRSVGIDIERLRAMPDAVGIARRILGAASAAILEQLDDPRRDLVFLRLWTAHEACIKALGLALAVAEQSVRIGWADRGPVCEWADPRAAPYGLDLRLIATVPSHVAALAWARRPTAGTGADAMRIARFNYAASLADF